MSAFSPKDVQDLLDLAERQAEELRELRRELERQTALLERLLEKLASLERSQYSGRGQDEPDAAGLRSTGRTPYLLAQRDDLDALLARGGRQRRVRRRDPVARLGGREHVAVRNREATRSAIVETSTQLARTGGELERGLDRPHDRREKLVDLGDDCVRPSSVGANHHVHDLGCVHARHSCVTDPKRGRDGVGTRLVEKERDDRARVEH